MTDDAVRCWHLAAYGSCIMSLAAVVIAAVALARVGEVSQSMSGDSPDAGALRDFSDFQGLWEATGQSVILRGPYNSSVVSSTFTSGSLLYAITVVDSVGRFEGIRCPSQLTNSTGAPATIGGVIDQSRKRAQASIYFSNFADTPQNRWGLWQWNFRNSNTADLFLENAVNIETQDARAFVGASLSRRISDSSTCPGS